MLAGAPRLEVRGAVLAGVRFLPLAWRHAWPSLTLACAAFGLWLSAPRDLAAAAIAVLTVWIAQGALWRIAYDWILHRGGLHIGHVEWRLAAAWLLAAAFLAIVALLALVVLLAGAYGVASAGAGFVATRPDSWPAATHGRGFWVLGALGLIAALALVMVALRLSLAAAATGEAGRVRVLSTWATTRGEAARLAVAFTVLAAAPLALLAAAWGLARSAPQPETRGLAGALALAGWLPLHAGCAAHAWRRLAPAGGRRASP